MRGSKLIVPMHAFGLFFQSLAARAGMRSLLFFFRASALGSVLRFFGKHPGGSRGSDPHRILVIASSSSHSRHRILVTSPPRHHRLPHAGRGSDEKLRESELSYPRTNVVVFPYAGPGRRVAWRPRCTPRPPLPPLPPCTPARQRCGPWPQVVTRKEGSPQHEQPIGGGELWRVLWRRACRWRRQSGALGLHRQKTMK
jgi:hypothetical protein